MPECCGRSLLHDKEDCKGSHGYPLVCYEPWAFTLRRERAMREEHKAGHIVHCVKHCLHLIFITCTGLQVGSHAHSHACQKTILRHKMPKTPACRNTGGHCGNVCKSHHFSMQKGNLSLGPPLSHQLIDISIAGFLIRDRLYLCRQHAFVFSSCPSRAYSYTACVSGNYGYDHADSV